LQRFNFACHTYFISPARLEVSLGVDLYLGPGRMTWEHCKSLYIYIPVTSP